MTLRRGCNGWARKPRWSLGSDFGSWSAATYCVRWLQDTVPRLCAKFGELRLMFSEVSSRSSMKWIIGNHHSTICLKRGSASSKWLNWDWYGLVELSTETIQRFACVNVTPPIEFTASKTKGHNKTFHRDILIHEANKASGCCLSLQLKLILWYRVLLKKYWQSSRYEETLSRLWFLKMEFE